MKTKNIVQSKRFHTGIEIIVSYSLNGLWDTVFYYCISEIKKHGGKGWGNWSQLADEVRFWFVSSP